MTRIALVLGHDACAGYRDGGAIGLIMRELRDATPPGQDARIFGPPDAIAPLAGPGFAAVVPSWWDRLRRPKAAYRSALIRALRRFGPAIIEVHNQRVLPERLKHALPGARIVSVLHSPVEFDLAERTAWLSAVDAAVCVSDFIRTALVAGVPRHLAERARTIYNPLPAVPPAPDAARERMILFAGRIVPEKGPDAFVAAAAMLRDRLPGWRFLLIGSEGADPTAEERRFADRVRHEATAAGVEAMGHLSNLALLSAMAKAAIIVMPSRVTEALGRVAQEALASGAALITTRRGGIPEAAGDAAIYVDPDRPGEIAEAILRLAGDDAYRADMVGRGLGHVQRFGIGDIMRQWMALRTTVGAQC
jgi:UDP-glucose:(glucosyl)LPS alpha-1,2-glucosyltransferase